MPQKRNEFYQIITTMELQITVTLSDRLFALLEDKLPSLGRRMEKALTKEIGATVRDESGIKLDMSTTSVQAEEQEKPKRGRKAKAEQSVEVHATESVQTEEPAATETAPAAATPVAPMEERELTVEDLRAAMHRTRQRFEGEDYLDHPESENYQKYHKALKSMFLQIAASLGSDKPSSLPADKRAAFIAECEALVIDDSGRIAPPRAPF